MQIVRKLEMRTRSWRRGVVGWRSFEEAGGGVVVSSSWFVWKVVSWTSEAGEAILNWQLVLSYHHLLPLYSE